jgi:ribonuclease HI
MKRAIFDIFTDGSSKISKDMSFYESSSAYLVTSGDDNKLLSGGKYHIGGTISTGEAYAVLMGLKAFESMITQTNISKNFDIVINIHMDSAFVRDSLKSWVYGWSKAAGRHGTWINSKKEPVACQDIFKGVFYEFVKTNNYEINFCKINGHIGEKISIKDALKKYNNKNDTKLTMDEFKILVKGNQHVDKLAEEVRKDRLIKHRCIYNYNGRGNHLWEKVSLTKENKVKIKNRKEKKDNRTRIKSRKRKGDD